MTPVCPRSAVLATALVAAVLVLAGCASAPPDAGKQAPAAPAPSAAAVAPVSPAPVAQPAPEPVPAPDPAVARPQAQKLALESVDQLQNGDEYAARATLERAAQLDPGNDLARKLSDQIRADAQRELGPVYFRYTVQKDDTLSKLAQQFMGDRFRFYILAKYNDITNPSRLAAGQVIRVPGRAPPPAAAATPPVDPAPTVATPPPPEPKPRDDVADALKKVAELERAGNLEAAYFAYTDLAQRYPASAEATKRRDASRATFLRQLDREATTAFQRQNLDLAIAKWDRMLEIDPGNKKARLERERALDLKRRLAAKQGAK